MGAIDGMEAEHDAGLPLHLLLAVGVHQQREGHPVGSGGGLDDVRQVALIGGLVEILELLARVLLVPAEVVVAAVVDALDLVPAEGEFVLDVVRRLGVVRQLAGPMRMPAQLRGGQTGRVMPGHSPLAPALEPLLIGPRLHEELHLHLLEFTGPEDEVARGDLVAERLADLGDPEGDLLAGGVQHVLVVDVDALRGLGTEVDDRRLLLHRTHEGLEHQIEHPGLGQLTGAMLARMLARLLRALGVSQLVGPEPRLAGLAVDQGIGEAGHMPARLPDPRMHEDGGIEALDVVAGMDHGPPPAILDVLLEFHAERTVVPHGPEPAVDLATTGRRSRVACRARPVFPSGRDRPWVRWVREPGRAGRKPRQRRGLEQAGAGCGGPGERIRPAGCRTDGERRSTPGLPDRCDSPEIGGGRRSGGCHYLYALQPVNRSSYTGTTIA